MQNHWLFSSNNIYFCTCQKADEKKSKEDAQTLEELNSAQCRSQAKHQSVQTSHTKWIKLFLSLPYNKQLINRAKLVCVGKLIKVDPTISGPFQSFQTYIYVYRCWPKHRGAGPEKIAKVNASGANQGAFLQFSWGKTFGCGLHRITSFCFFQVLIQHYSALLPLSAAYNFLHSWCSYKVDRANMFLHFHVRSLDMLMSIEIDKSRYKLIASSESSVIIDFYWQIKLINRQLLSTIDLSTTFPMIDSDWYVTSW